MTKAVSYAYVNQATSRPPLIDQFAACRVYAVAHGYMLDGEFNDIDEPDHLSQGAALAAVRDAVANDGAAVVLVYAPDQDVVTHLQSFGATVEPVLEIAHSSS